MRINVKDLVEIFLILFLAFFIYRVLMPIAFGHPYTLTVVVSGSMMHVENLDKKHYEFLEKNFGYNKSFIDSWPLKKGFGIGDILVVLKSKNYSVGDVIVFENKCQKIPIAHRIIYINSDGTYQTKGDNNYLQNLSICYNEKKISEDEIYGKVVFVIPKIGLIRYLIYLILGF